MAPEITLMLRLVFTAGEVTCLPHHADVVPRCFMPPASALALIIVVTLHFSSVPVLCCPVLCCDVLIPVVEGQLVEGPATWLLADVVVDLLDALEFLGHGVCDNFRAALDTKGYLTVTDRPSLSVDRAHPDSELFWVYLGKLWDVVRIGTICILQTRLVDALQFLQCRMWLYR